MTLGQKILESRKKKGYSQEELGEKINVTRQTISNWELDITSPDPDQLKRLSKTLEISVDNLLDNEVYEKGRIVVSERQKRTIRRISTLLLKGFLVLLVIDLITFIIMYAYKVGPFKNIKSENSMYVIKNTNI